MKILRWWENYFVRYLVGTVVGSVMVISLTRNKELPFKQLSDFLTNEKSDFLGVGLVGVAGFAFCYIASSPILAVHALRAHLRSAVIRRSLARHIVVWSIVLAGIAATLIIWAQEPKIVWGAYLSIVGAQVGLIAAAAATRFREVENFYRVLAARRGAALNHDAEHTTVGSEYITSYRHLREHGNAVLIVLMQFVLALVLSQTRSFTAAALVVAGWLAPGGLTWLVGTIMESRMVEKRIRG